MPRALLRAVPDTFDQAIVGSAGRRPLVDLARDQHARYRQCLQSAGYETEVLAADDDHPDCVFIEDTAVIVGDLGVVTRPGASSRRSEITEVARVLEGHMPIVRIREPGTLDGGDVMMLGNTIYAGLSGRTNANGIEQLRAIGAGQGLNLVAVPVKGVLHLKSAVLPVDAETLVVTRGTVDTSLLDGFRIVDEEPEERHRFSALPLESGDVLVTENAPRTSHSVAELGLNVIPIDVSEIQAADGGLTCLSILY